MIFETEQDLLKEEKVALRFANVGGYECKKLPRNAIDYLLLRDGKGVCFLEIKCLNNYHNKYSVILNSLYKWDKMMQYEQLLPTYLVYGYIDDVILYIRAKDIKGNIKWSGRKPREGAANDMEACIFIPREKMKTL